MLAVALAAGFALMAQKGAFNNLALAREHSAHRAEFAQQLWRHLELVGAAVTLALIFSLPLTALALRRAGARGPLFASLGIVPDNSLDRPFRRPLIAPLSALGARFPPISRGGRHEDRSRACDHRADALFAGAASAQFRHRHQSRSRPEPKQAALGLGFDRRQLFLAVELPLAAPALISGLRVVVIQAIGLTTVAALIGAGGLGVFVFQGIGQYALDLVLLGAIPVILLALAADLFFQILIAATRRRL